MMCRWSATVGAFSHHICWMVGCSTPIFTELLLIANAPAEQKSFFWRKCVIRAFFEIIVFCGQNVSFCSERLRLRFLCWIFLIRFIRIYQNVWLCMLSTRLMILGAHKPRSFTPSAPPRSNPNSHQFNSTKDILKTDIKSQENPQNFKPHVFWNQ